MSKGRKYSRDSFIQSKSSCLCRRSSSRDPASSGLGSSSFINNLGEYQETLREREKNRELYENLNNLVELEKDVRRQDIGWSELELLDSCFKLRLIIYPELRERVVIIGLVDVE